MDLFIRFQLGYVYLNDQIKGLNLSKTPSIVISEFRNMATCYSLSTAVIMCLIARESKRKEAEREREREK